MDGYISTMDLGELTDRANQVLSEVRSRDAGVDPMVVYDDYRRPKSLHTWRADYNELSLSGTGDGMLLTQFISMLEEANGATFIGYKGGDYKMNRETSVWGADHSSADSIAIIGVEVDGDVVVLQTKDLDEE